MSRSSGLSGWLYRLLLLAYPPDFRSEHGDELVELFEYRRREAGAGDLLSRLGFWPRIMVDWSWSVWRERRDPDPGGSGDQNRKGGERMRGWIEDLGYAARRLVRSPAFSLAALVILVLGIGVNTTAFGFVNSLLFQAPPFVDADRVVLVLQDSDGGVPNSTSYPAYQDITRYDVFESVSAYNSEQVFVELDQQLVPTLTEYATASYLNVTGLQTTRGRWFDVTHDDPFGPPVAVVTHRYWVDRLGSDPEVIGRELRIGGRAIPVIGVGPETFNGGIGPAAIDLWLSISAMAPTGGRAASLTRRADHPFMVRARLADGVSVEQAQSAMDGLAGDLAATYPELNATRGISVLTSMAPDVQARVLPVAVLAMSVVFLVLVIATLNLSNLLLVRTAARSQELAVRLALGSGRSGLVRVVFAEAILLAVLGGLGGIAAALAVNDVLRKSWFDLGLPTALDISIDTRVIMFAIIATTASALLFGLIPALRSTRDGIANTLRGDEAGAGIGARRRFGLTGALVAGQVAASLVLLAVAGVFLESVSRAQGASPGFEWEGTGFVSISLQPLDLDRGSLGAMHDQIVRRVQAVPAVENVSFSALIPGRMFGTTTLLLGSGAGAVDRPTEIPWNAVQPNYFDVLDVPLVAGRGFEEADLSGPDIAVVSETMARTFWGRSDVVGETYRSENDPDSPVEIVGVVGDVTVRALGEAPAPTVYWPGAGGSFGHILFRARGDEAGALAGIRAALAEVDERILVTGSSTMEEHLGSTLQTQRLAGGMLGALGVLALLIAVLGVYGVVSFAVSRRQREVGIRIALGAGREAVVGLFARDVAVVVLAGGGLGLLASVPLSRLVASVFTGSPATLLSTTGAAGLLVATALVATIVPAHRAARTDPTEALRQE